MKSIEFITVHCTANFRDGANALAHANYWAQMIVEAHMLLLNNLMLHTK